MNTNNEKTETKRGLLLGARIRFSPAGANVRERAIIRIIEQNLACLDENRSLSIKELCNFMCFTDQPAILRDADVREGIRILHDNNRLNESKVDDQTVFSLSKTARDEVSHLENECQRRNTSIIKDLFGKLEGTSSSYTLAFFDLLASIFSKLTDMYVQSITMGGKATTFADDRILDSTISQIFNNHTVQNKTGFTYGVKRFFRESKPEFDELKWNMAQNYYVAKALGSDKSADLLSINVLKGGNLYCDTNVLIAALVPECRHHSSFQVLLRSCEVMGMSLRAAYITIQELRSVIYSYGELLIKVADKIPRETSLKVRNFLFESYLAEKDRDPEITVDSFLSQFEHMVDRLEADLKISIVDNQMFDAIARDAATKTLSYELVSQYEISRGRKKGENAAIHDAELIIFVRKENEANRKSWIITLDTSLATWQEKRENEICKLLTLDALLQWLAPSASGTEDEDHLAKIFSESLRYKMLPRDVFFDLRDFQIFAEMGIETGQLPSDDVEACIREIRKVSVNLDPSKPADREKMNLIIQRYFADPGTKYQHTIHELQANSDTLNKELDQEKRLRIDAEIKFNDLAIKSEEMSKQIETEKSALSSAMSRIKNLEDSKFEQEKTDKHKQLVTSVIRRSLFALMLLIILELIIGYFAWRYGEGENLFLKLTNAWVWLCLGFACIAVIYRFILMGRDRMRLLKWWKGETD